MLRVSKHLPVFSNIYTIFEGRCSSVGYIKYNDTDKYHIEVITYNHYVVMCNDEPVMHCDTYEQAQHYIDSIIFNFEYDC